MQMSKLRYFGRKVRYFFPGLPGVLPDHFQVRVNHGLQEIPPNPLITGMIVALKTQKSITAYYSPKIILRNQVLSIV
jgi:hypothetical protein